MSSKEDYANAILNKLKNNSPEEMQKAVSNLQKSDNPKFRLFAKLLTGEIDIDEFDERCDNINKRG